ncbi:MAG: hypothetical protein A2249_03015 [Candidatus Jacksonbacteria bacterium RIFOXYA2_FULL_44_7]|nr:MAG: putative glucose-1-phosphate thymidylyltransferase [Parcubacteria group bacterium GW2011_GWC2_44_17]KKT49997.1 MAG: putative glucose-1-phosphate thymidylyltransferase [Parcubacteria group bacterium GW2011_GWF2_44_17]OGY77186.1 MAG: hypothetical protein A2249_03015 [Candidatus Jacksonbacteria bacterium RIFOXYA2_FULL_44_7]HCE86253.1 hypothetical protein [Candidatus Jacksonbacteria bacterium]
MYPITLTKQLDDIEICGMRLKDLEHPDFEYPWEIIAWQRENALKIVELRITDYELREKNVYVGKNVAIDQFVIFNTDQGVIIIDDCAHVYPFSYIEGPCYIGAHTEIKSHSQIRKNTSIGHHCKIGGEVSGSIFQPYTNKAHHGFVGDSYIGSWVNLGAGTTTSNLKNTYGPVRIEYSGEKIDTGMQFLGCIIGDYVKTAINTSIYTGKIIGVYAQLFGCVTENIGSFVMDTHEGKKVFELESAIRAQKRSFERRGIEQKEEDIEFLKRVFEETKDERSFISV